MYKSSTNHMSLVCDPNYSITSSIDLLSNFLSPNIWNFIFIKFIEKFPLFYRFNTILVITKKLTKYVILIYFYDIITSTKLAWIFVLYMFSKHNVSSYVTSNYSLEFILNYLDTVLEIHHFTLGYHPKCNEQIEYTNQTLK